MNRLRLHTVTRGDPCNPPVLFLHGYLGSHREWLPFMQDLSDSYYCIAVDLPGHGQSAAFDDEESYTFAGSAQRVLDALPLVEQKGLRLVGYSMGGRLSLYLAIYHSDHIQQAIIESSSPGLLDARTAQAREKQDAGWADRFRAEPIDVVLEDWYRQPIFCSLRAQPEMFEQMLKERRQNEGDAVARSIKGMSVGRQQPLWDALPQLEVDVCLIIGGLDRKYQQVARQMCSASARIHMESIEGAGHNVHLEQPDLFSKCVREQLDKTQA